MFCPKTGLKIHKLILYPSFTNKEDIPLNVIQEMGMIFHN